MKRTINLVLIGLLLFSAGNLFSQETKIMVRAQAKDAKFIGTSMGGAKIIIRDVETGKILDEGLTKGITGDTEVILLSPRERYKEITTEKTAGYEASLKLDKPTFVSIEAQGPMSKKQAKVVSSTQLWVIPGKDITGDGIILEIPGFVVDVLSPQTHETISAGTEIEIRANIVMMCGCPVTEEGTWDASGYEIKALISSEGKEHKEINLNSTDKASTFSETVKLVEGDYEIEVYAYDPKTGNTGLDRVNIIVN
ncbi:hypothetical protein [Salegentibacter flavus]|uniref:Uncharacterized protein n=1 Tax=Salegentibacter flavus TaxID=287099 RepID=A0A1I5CVU9_9FLAO|nr:hypothetical protein [Salegentibacter flavus]SFN90996.1 hypothetical protein SAMN05660413_03031 [Salegentibacter flavus]